MAILKQAKATGIKSGKEVTALKSFRKYTLKKYL
jgi:hypothetical protein